MKRLLETQDSIGLFILRFSIGLMFSLHGAQKLFGLFGGTGIPSFARHLAAMGMLHPTLQAYLAAGSEFFGGLLLLIGLYTRIAVFPPLAVMLVAFLKVHGPKGFFLQNGGFEYVFIISAGLFALLALGGGKFSLDRKMIK